MSGRRPPPRRLISSLAAKVTPKLQSGPSTVGGSGRLNWEDASRQLMRASKRQGRVCGPRVDPDRRPTGVVAIDTPVEAPLPVLDWKREPIRGRLPGRSYCRPRCCSRHSRGTTSPACRVKRRTRYAESIADRRASASHQNINWYRAALERDELLDILHINWDWWLTLTDGSRPRDAARKIHGGEIVGVHAIDDEPIALALYASPPPPELIPATTPNHNPIVLIEGHAAPDAYALYPEHMPPRMEILLGISEQMPEYSEF